MPNRARYRSKSLAAVHEMMSDLHRIGLVDNTTIHRFDASCLTPVPDVTPQYIVRLRRREHASQAVLARYLNVSKNSVSQWERGEKRPTGAAAKLLALANTKGLHAIA